MTRVGLEPIIRAHPLFAGLDEAFCQLVCGCATNVRFRAGDYLFHEGEAADRLFLLRQGRVALETPTPGQGAIVFRTLDAGELVGLSWLVPPYRWAYDARALEPIRAIAMDAVCLRRKCEQDHDLGFEVMKRVVPILIERLHGTQRQMLDVYGSPS
ncbi:cyclic nucleotide-binding domain-containing protein [Modicisalibacter sp. 'Wilcox']|uniref:cyclic nucleotide-binding domain-containing protein n=1 Tax=Modicisalibacter sp. 'Wilcox' TaxID=2679914 RepID=UPI0013CFD28F|nr:cyclic nucleotide-binding domain-containing protein [Modicisalibacter sp. 'Wilcox']